jgi:hypothetical protein
MGGKGVVENKPFQGHFIGVEDFIVPFLRLPIM